jgi:MarR family transcriptional regulator, organic hydroperoxide resistance regulator
MKGDLRPQFAGPDDSPGFLLWQVANGWQRHQRQALEEIGLTHAQFALLAGLGWLRQGDGVPITQSMLARHSRVDAMMTSQVIGSLEKRGAVIRQAHPTDSRAKTLALTVEGADLLEKALPLVEQADAAFFLAAGGGLEGMIEALKIIAKAARDDRPVIRLNGTRTSRVED